MMVAVSADRTLLDSLSSAALDTRSLVQCGNTGDALRALATGDARLIVIDEDALLPGFCDCVIASARRFTPAAKIIYLTSEPRPWREAEVRGAGVNFYAAKPITDEVLGRIARALTGTQPARIAI